MFLSEPPSGAGVEAFYAADVASDGYVMNLTRVWGWRPEVAQAFQAVRGTLTAQSALTARELAVLTAALAGTLGDAYCGLAWGDRLASLSTGDAAAAVLTGAEDPELTAREAALAAWARAVVRDPNATTAADVDRLRAAGLDDRQIFEATAWIAFRLAFSTVNDALGAVPDRELTERANPAVRDAVTFGRLPRDD